MKAYKVINQDLKSMNAGNPIQYKVDEWVNTINVSKPLFVFDTLDNAKAFAIRYNNAKIYECEVDGVVESHDNCRLSDCPAGTFFACKVKLTQLVVNCESTFLKVGDIIANQSDSLRLMVCCEFSEKGFRQLEKTFLVVYKSWCGSANGEEYCRRIREFKTLEEVNEKAHSMHVFHLVPKN